MGFRASIDLKLGQNEAFEVIADELAVALANRGLEFKPGISGGIWADDREVGRVLRWRPTEEIELEWNREDWQRGQAAAIGLQFERIDGGTRVTLECSDAGNLLIDEGAELAGWFASEVAAPLLLAMGPARLGEWITDRRARRPSGAQARATYRDPLYHRPNFKAILKILKLTPADYLLEVGCGGGAFLKDALASGCKAAAIDHSPDMIRAARETNSEAIGAKRLEIRQADAGSLPFPDRAFTCAVMTGVFGFISDPIKALREVWRVLALSGRFVLFTGSKELRGTPAAPEPIASRLYFYEDQELEDLARKAGFREVHLERPDFEAYAREAGIPEESLQLFKGRGGGQLLAAHKA